MVIVTIFVIPFEIIQAIKERWDYFKDVNNWNDMLFLITLISYMSSNATTGSTKSDSVNYESTRILLSFLLMFGFIKCISLFRVNDNVVFIWRMLIKVVVSIIPFLSLFTCLIIVFSFIVYALGLRFESLGDDNPYRSIEILGFLIYIFRNSIGDFDVD